MKRCIFIFLISILLIALCACGEEGDVVSNYSLVSEPVKLSEELSKSGFVSVVYDKLYFEKLITTGSAETGDLQREIQLISVNADGSDVEVLKDYDFKLNSQNKFELISILDILPAEADQLWVLEWVSAPIFDLPDNFNGSDEDKWQYETGMNESYFVRKLDSTGAELLSVELKEVELGEKLDIIDVGSNKDGDLVIAANRGRVFVFDQDGTLKCKLTDKVNLQSIINLRNGDIGVIAAPVDTTDGKHHVRRINIEEGSWEKLFDLPVNKAFFTFPCDDRFDFFYNEEDGLYGYEGENEKSSRLISWGDFGIESGDVSSCYLAKNGDISVLTINYDGQGGMYYEIYQFAEDKDNANLDNRTRLTLAGIKITSEIRQQVMSFNKNNDKYIIEIIDYADNPNVGDISDAVTILSTEMVSGNIPDILMLSMMPWEQYAAKGLLEDLYPYIDNDKDLKREDFIPNILKAAETDGKLYQAISSFVACGFAGSKTVLGSESGWTMEQMLNVIKNNPEADVPFGYLFNPADGFTAFCTANMGSYINWETAECNFDTPEFKSLLELTKRFNDYESEGSEDLSVIPECDLINSKRQLCSLLELWPIWNVGYYSALFGDDFVFRGFPSEDRDGGIAVFENTLAMTTACEDKEGAWQFLRGFLTEEYGKKLQSVPVNKVAFDELLKDAMETKYIKDENGKEVPEILISMPLGDSRIYEASSLTAKDVELYKEIVKNINKSAYTDISVMDILDEELSKYLEGITTVDEAAKYIQSRMSLYVSEKS